MAEEEDEGDVDRDAGQDHFAAAQRRGLQKQKDKSDKFKSPFYYQTHIIFNKLERIGGKTINH